jgi:hypothetical protein
MSATTTMMSKKEALAIVGGLSKPSKMPGFGYGLPALECGVGSRLRTVEGSTCSGCYALKGRYTFANVQAAQYRRLAALAHPEWVDAMAVAIASTGTDYFRWHDSGDLQSVGHLAMIVAVCERTPDVSHWLPTREVKILRDYARLYGRESIPGNLTIRVSAHMIGHAPPRAPMGFPFSTVTRDHGHDVGGGHVCPSREQGNSCGDCRACWDPAVAHVSYPVH